LFRERFKEGSGKRPWPRRNLSGTSRIATSGRSGMWTMARRR
jgi:hypothetical protein